MNFRILKDLEDVKNKIGDNLPGDENSFFFLTLEG